MKADKIIRSHRQSIGLQITPSGELVVHAPHLIPKFFIERFLDDKKEWIEKGMAQVQKHPRTSKRKYEEGEEFLYLGKSYQLHFGNFKDIHIKDNLNFPKVLEFRIKKELEGWYIRKAKEIITARVEHYAKEIGTSYKNLRFSETTSKWGTCFADNSLQFRWKLIMAPQMVLDYVVIHELAHTIEHNHSRDFWNIVRRFTPAYRQHRDWLNKNAHLLVI